MSFCRQRMPNTHLGAPLCVAQSLARWKVSRIFFDGGTTQPASEACCICEICQALADDDGVDNGHKKERLH